MPIPDSIAELVTRFEASRKEYRQGHYNETQTRIDYVNPLFAALGWDMDNREGLSELLREVVHEDSLKISGTTKAPDYSFRTGGARKFFLETKKPSVSVDLKEEPAYQLRRYAWTAKLPVSILTNFEEFAVYDGRVPPDKKDSPKKARLDYIKFTDYAARWDDLYARFSKDAVLSGAFDRYAEEAREKRLSLPVDAAFLAQISGWREKLAAHIIQKNAGLAPRELNYAVQMIIDRIIFLRISEDRGIEPTYLLQPLLNKGGPVYPRLLDIFRRADDRYNSGLFHLKPEKGRGDVDDVTPRLALDDRPLKEIIASIYYPESPFEFSVFPADILGHVYEQFLGKVIHVSGKTATVEDKPEVKKAGGVYYTPTYIVDYIVQNTVGKLVAGKTPAQVARLTILDPACGSGSFLIGAYQFLLDWHLRFYEADRKKWGRGKNATIYQSKIDPALGEVWRLTTAEKKRILRVNIYGVDIDTQAVEVTKLSLLLKVLEDESAELLDNTLKLYQERALPDLEANIKCGNSLIAPDFYADKAPGDFDLDARLKINAFDWHKEFAAIMSGGGFDAVIGNPPYLNVDDTWGKGDPRLAALKSSYPEIYNDKTDILFYFLGKAATLAKQSISFIISRAFLEAYKADKLREFMVKNTAVEQIVDFRNFLVFPRVGITTCIATFSLASKPADVAAYHLLPKTLPTASVTENLDNPQVFERFSLPQSKLNAQPWIFTSKASAKLNTKIDAAGDALGTVLAVGKGMETGRNNVFGHHTAQEIEDWKLKSGQFYQRATNSDIQRFYIKDRGEYLLYLEDETDFQQLSGKTQSYLKANRSELEARAAYKRGDCEWWQYTWPLHKDWYVREKLLCPYLASENRFAIDASRQFIGLTDTTALFTNGQPESLHYLLGLLNSRLLTFRFRSIGKLKSSGILEYFWNSISKLPIRRIDFTKPAEKAKHDKLVSLVDRMLTLHKDKAAVRLAREKAMVEQQIEETDAQIDRLVYDLYGLTDAEIAIVEGAQ